MPSEARAIELPDRRMLAWEEQGPADGFPVVFFHGTPSYRGAIRPPAGLLDAMGVRLIAVDRPGYGLSTFQPSRRLLDWPSDVRALVDHLGLDRFGVMGHSGGGPHTLVCARQIGDRITTAVLIGGYCPLDPTAKPSAPQRIGMLATRAPLAVRGVFAGTFFLQRKAPRVAARLFQRPLPEYDRRVLASAEAERAHLWASSPTAAKAAAQDMGLMTRPWGFALTDIRVPVHLWHGTADFNVPLHHSEYASRLIPDATLHVCEGAGHLLVEEHLPAMLEPFRP